jgi:hypothetical protein
MACAPTSPCPRCRDARERLVPTSPVSAQPMAVDPESGTSCDQPNADAARGDSRSSLATGPRGRRPRRSLAISNAQGRAATKGRRRRGPPQPHTPARSTPIARREGMARHSTFRSPPHSRGRIGGETPTRGRRPPPAGDRRVVPSVNDCSRARLVSIAKASGYPSLTGDGAAQARPPSTRNCPPPSTTRSPR